LIKVVFSILAIIFSTSVWSYQSHSHLPKWPRARAVIQPTAGHNVQGEFLFTQMPNGVRVNAILTGLTPNQKHGVHVHQWGDITDRVLGRSAGGHYNPQGHPHGLPPNPVRHAGAFGNIQANENGEAQFEFLDDTITIVGKKNPVLGRSVVVHARPDTGEQPVGNAGPRIGLGVIGMIAPD
jgi:Cu-Zn family superoxide dismutase